MVPVWPECWGYSCTGPTTYLGPGDFQRKLVLAFKFWLDDDAVLTMSGNGVFKLKLDSKGAWSLNSKSGHGLNFPTGAWHDIELSIGAQWQTIKVDGKLLANTTAMTVEQQSAEVCGNASFPVDLSGKQYMNLDAGPASATTPMLCQQACCDRGEDCNIWQFSTHPSKKPNCWVGASTMFTPDSQGEYVSRGRTAPAIPGWKLEVQLSRYVFAAIDDFSISPM